MVDADHLQGVPAGACHCQQTSLHADVTELVGKTSLVVGLAALSFNSATREQMPTLQPPDKAAYLSNIAVEPRYRRYGQDCLPSTSMLSVVRLVSSM